MQESLIALKTILKEIDPITFDSALKMNPAEKKLYQITQDAEDRKALDKKWDILNKKVATAHPTYR